MEGQVETTEETVILYALPLNLYWSGEVSVETGAREPKLRWTLAELDSHFQEIEMAEGSHWAYAVEEARALISPGQEESIILGGPIPISPVIPRYTLLYPLEPIYSSNPIAPPLTERKRPKVCVPEIIITDMPTWAKGLHRGESGGHKYVYTIYALHTLFRHLIGGPEAVEDLKHYLTQACTIEYYRDSLRSPEPTLALRSILALRSSFSRANTILKLLSGALISLGLAFLLAERWRCER